MYSTDTKSKFLELRAKDWSLVRISKELNVGVRTLVDWNRQSRDELRALRAVEIEALQEKLLATHEHQLTTLVTQLNRLDERIAMEKLEFVETKDLYRIAASVRSQVLKLMISPEEFDAEEET
jgi:hypothetical protein